jgi:hypothetical protein
VTCILKCRSNMKSEEHCLLACYNVYSGRRLPTSRRNVLSSSSESKGKPNNKPSKKTCTVLHCVTSWRQFALLFVVNRRENLKFHNVKSVWKWKLVKLNSINHQASAYISLSSTVLNLLSCILKFVCGAQETRGLSQDWATKEVTTIRVPRFF